MSSQPATAVIVCGVSLGDEGKGTTIDFLARHMRASLIVRFNGGPQAAHHVVRAHDGAVHCFSQFGATLACSTECAASAALVVATLLSAHALVAPVLLQREADALARLGVANALQHHFVDRRCVVVTHYHRVLGQLQELLRGHTRFGSTGLGVGVAATDAAAWAEQQQESSTLVAAPAAACYVLRMEDTLDEARTRAIVEAQRARVLSRSQALVEQQQPQHQQLRRQVDALLAAAHAPVDGVVRELCAFAQRHARNVVDGASLLREYLRRGDTVLFEGAQGALLDCTYGWRPYVTKTSCQQRNALELLRAADSPHRLVRIGVLRTYAHRHGAGPLVTQCDDMMFRLLVPEMHNGTHEWQGEFRVGHCDLVALRYGVAVAGPLDALVLTHVDRVQPSDPFTEWQLCTAYALPPTPPLSSTQLAFLRDACGCDVERDGDELLLVRLRVGPDASVPLLTQLLSKCTPARWLRIADTAGECGVPSSSPASGEPPLTQFQRDVIATIERELATPIALLSLGPTASSAHKFLTAAGRVLLSSPQSGR